MRLWVNFEGILMCACACVDFDDDTLNTWAKEC